MQTPNSVEVTRPAVTAAEVAGEAIKAKLKAEADKWAAGCKHVIKSLLSGNEAKSM